MNKILELFDKICRMNIFFYMKLWMWTAYESARGIVAFCNCVFSCKA